ncbi:ATP-binding protein [Candidatus Pacearchaeota archaeon]|nr:ATP-binding protein [Candidatus Pacearchaeota archaeon]
MTKSQSNDNSLVFKARLKALIHRAKNAIDIRKENLFEGTIKKNLPSDQKKGFSARMEAARERIKNGQANLENDAGLYVDEKGLEYVDLDKMVSFMDKEKDQDALKTHQNDPNKRLDLYKFPTDRKDRTFLLNHNFGHYLKEILKIIDTNWVFLWGDQGRGKTALATRAIWELIKNHPSWKADFVSINALTQAKNDEDAPIDISKLKRFILIDDFDTFDFDKEYRIRQVLRLIENIKNRHKVIITSNRSLIEMSKVSKYQKFDVMLDRIKGRSVVFPRFTGASYR